MQQQRQLQHMEFVCWGRIRMQTGYPLAVPAVNANFEFMAPKFSVFRHCRVYLLRPRQNAALEVVDLSESRPP